MCLVHDTKTQFVRNLLLQPKQRLVCSDQQHVKRQTYKITVHGELSGVTLKHLDVGHATRCCQKHPTDIWKEASGREMVSCVILAAAVLAGKAGVLQELLLLSDNRDTAWRLEQRL